MPALAIVSPSPFANNLLPSTPVDYVKPVPGAMFDFTAQMLTTGDSATHWYSAVSNDVLAYTGGITQRPLVKEDPSGTRYLSFDGSNDRLDMGMDLSGDFVMVVVARLPQPGGYPITSGGIGEEFLWGAFGDASNYTLTLQNRGFVRPYVAADNGWHVHVMAISGAASSYVLDGRTPVVTNVSGGYNLTHLRVGAAQSTYEPIDIARLAIVPGTMSDARMQALATELAEAHNI